MPIYSIQCKTCLRRGGDIFRTVAERDFNLPSCITCSGESQRVICAPAIRPDIPHYISPASGKLITSREQRKEDLLSTGHIEWEPGMDKDIARRRQDRIEESFAPLDKTVDDMVASMNVAGKLENLNAA